MVLFKDFIIIILFFCHRVAIRSFKCKIMFVTLQMCLSFDV